MQFQLKVSIFQLYMEKIRDLLDVNKTDLKIRENKNGGPYVEHLTQAFISDKMQLHKLINLGQKNRITCATNMNAQSSRSHMIFVLTVSQCNLQSSQAKTSKLYLIDLAGSEKVSKTGAEGKVLDQAKKINLSLTCLGIVIKALSENHKFIPFRDSKLTRIMKDSLGGNSKTTLIVTCSPHGMHISQTISTLRFGQNAQRIQNKPKINRELTVPQLQKMIEELEAKIEEKDSAIKILEGYIKNQLKAKLPVYEKKKKVEKVGEQNQERDIDDGGQSRNNNEEVEQVEINTGNVKEEKIEKQIDDGLKIGENQKDEEGNGVTEFISQDKFQTQIEQESAVAKKASVSQLAANAGQEQEQAGMSYRTPEKEVADKYMEMESEAMKQTQGDHGSPILNPNNTNNKGLWLQNIQKEYEQKLTMLEQSIKTKYIQNSKLIFEEILHHCIDCKNVNMINSCYKKVKEVIEKKSKILYGSTSNNGDNLIQNLGDINDEYQQIIDRQRQKQLQHVNQNIQFSPSLSQKKSENGGEENKKILDLQKKLNALFTSYQQMLNFQTMWKIQCQIYEQDIGLCRHKLEIKDNIIAQLCKCINEVEDDGYVGRQNDDFDDNFSINTKIKKTLIGGGKNWYR